MASSTHYRAKLAALSRDRSQDDPELIAVRRDYRAERLAEFITKTVAEASPLTPAQRDRLAVLLRGGAA